MAEFRKKTEYAFVVFVDLFSRYAYAKWFEICKKGNKCNKGSINEEDMIEMPKPTEEVDLKGCEADLQDDGKATGLAQKEVLQGLKDLYKKIDDLGYKPPMNFISDNGVEFGFIPKTGMINTNSDIHKFLKPLNT